MNAALSAIALMEGESSRLMLPPPSAFHDHGGGRVEEVPLISKDFLMRCGVEALYIVLSEMDAPERFAAETKADLADLIISKTSSRQPDTFELPPPLIPARPLPARAKRFRRSVKKQVKQAVKDARAHREN